MEARIEDLKVEVSTLDVMFGGWETCLFHDNGHSSVVQRWPDQDAAISGHNVVVATLTAFVSIRKGRSH